MRRADNRTYHVQVPIVLKSGNLNLLEPSGPVQACNEIALTLLLHSASREAFTVTILLVD